MTEINEKLKPEDIYNYIVEKAKGFENEDLKKVVLHIYNEHKEKMLKISGGKVHHTRSGEFLVHVYDMLRTAESIAQIYDSEVLNKELLFAGIMVHDVGKITTIEYNADGLALFDTKEAVMLSTHIYVGAAYIREVCNELNINPDISLELQHIILSHHGYKAEDSASISDPMLPEAYILHMCDALDSRMNLITKSLSNVKPGEQTHIGKARFYRSVLTTKKAEE